MNKIKKLLTVFVFLLIIFSFSCCNTSQSSKIKVSSQEISVIADKCDESLLISTAKKSEMKKITASGILEMYLDEKTMSVCIYDTVSKKLYTSLPKASEGEVTSTVSLGFILGGREYMLTSQRDSLAFACTKYKKTKDGIVITYSFRQNLENNKKLNISVPVSYVLSDGMLNVSVDCNKIDNDGDGVIHTIELLPYFSSDTNTAKGDYIVLPDGCGAIMELETNSDKAIEVSLPVYGGDISMGNNELSQALVGAFGRKCGDTAFACLVNEGEAMCQIKASRAGSKGHNKVWTSFEITPAKTDESHIYISDNSYKGKISLSYRFLSGDNANYIGMASAVRELLIRKAELRENSLDEKAEYPFNLTLVLSENKQNDRGDNYTQYLTDFNEGYELLTSLKAKGLSDINVRLKGIYSGTDTKIDEELGSEQELDLLLSTQNDGTVNLYSDYALYSSKSSAKGIDKNKINLTSHKEIKHTLNSFITKLRKQSFQGISINDAGKSLNSDFSDKEFSIRENVKSSLREILGSIFASKKLMISGGNLYSIKYACQIIDLPSTSSLKNQEHFRDIPFIQAILHGIVDYSHEAANLTADSKESMLKAAEYGALPHYQWHCCSDTDKGDANTYYMLTLGEAKAYYDKMKNDFSRFRSRRITSHEKIKDEVYLTRFGEDAGVYVNYSDKAVSVAGITIDAKSYALIN